MLLRTVCVVAAILIFTGCTTKQYYSTNSVINSDDICGTDETIFERTLQDGKPIEKIGIECYTRAALIFSGATAAIDSSGTLITKDAQLTLQIPKDDEFLSLNDDVVLSVDLDGNLNITSLEDGSRDSIELGRTVAAASVDGDLLAVLFASNDMALYTLHNKELIYRFSSSAPIVVDSRIQPPHFLGKLVLFFTLDGKLVVIDTQEKELLRSTIVSSQPYFDNIIYFNSVDDTLFLATQYKIFTLVDREYRASFNLRDALFDRDGIWLATKEGEIIHLDERLNIIAKKKFPFAHFLAMIATDEKIYVLEKNGYLIEIDKEFAKEKIYSIDIDEGFVFASDSAFYVHDKKIVVR